MSIAMAAIKNFLILAVFAAVFVVVKLDDCDKKCSDEDAKEMIQSFINCLDSGECSNKVKEIQNEECKECIKREVIATGNVKADCLMEETGYKADPSPENEKAIGKKLMAECTKPFMAQAQKMGLMKRIKM